MPKNTGSLADVLMGLARTHSSLIPFQCSPKLNTSIMEINSNNEQDESDCTFQWDENSQLYYHASSGFYHDPQAGWYYNSRDGLYYKFENGNYVLLDSNQKGEDQSEMVDTNGDEKSEAEKQVEGVSVGPSQDSMASSSNDQPEYPPPPSEWLEDTLIDMFLSGNSNQTTGAPSDSTTVVNNYTEEKIDTSSYGDGETDELEEGEWIPDDPQFLSNLTEESMNEGISQEEENWRAQYGQVCELEEDWMSDLQAVDLWDWGLVKEMKKNGKTEVTKLVGRLKKRSSRIHPSVPAGGGKLKTAPVCEVHLNMVRVTSGRIYRLRIPSMQYLACLSVYDSSNPTKDWGFPQLSNSSHSKKLPKYDSQSESQTSEVIGAQKHKSRSSKTLSVSKKEHIYRDRAAERRNLHGGFGVGPGQKKSLTAVDSNSEPSSHTLCPEEAATESLNISFGEGSYARKILQNMGWKQGESLGSSMKGLTEPLQAVGNKGSAGLGWTDGRRKQTL